MPTSLCERTVFFKISDHETKMGWDAGVIVEFLPWAQ